MRSEDDRAKRGQSLPPNDGLRCLTLRMACPWLFSQLDRLASKQCGAVAEWSKALAWKVSIRQNRIEGSNPSRSATTDSGFATYMLRPDSFARDGARKGCQDWLVTRRPHPNMLGCILVVSLSSLRAGSPIPFRSEVSGERLKRSNNVQS
jgi:hypothetical protein